MNAVSQLDLEWCAIASGTLAEALPRWQRKQQPLRRFESPTQLLRFLHQTAPDESDGPLLALLALAPDDPLAGRLVLQAILPALKAQSRRIAHAGGAEELWELLLFHGWQAICCYPVATRTRRVAANLVLQVLHATTRELQHEQRRNGTPGHPTDPGPFAPEGAETTVLLAAEHGFLTEGDAELILRTRVDGVRLRLVSQVLGLSYEALRKRRQRAERRLRLLIVGRCDVPKTAVSDLISGAQAISRAAGEAA